MNLFAVFAVCSGTLQLASRPRTYKIVDCYDNAKGVREKLSWVILKTAYSFGQNGKEYAYQTVSALVNRL